jgi:hypothetical protein
MFQSMDPWDVALLAVAAYIAVVALVRLMVYHRDKLVAQFRAQVAAEHHRQEAADRDRGRQEAAAKNAAARNNVA